jgi:hypothetical protein
MNKHLVYIVSISDPTAKVDHSLYSKYCIESWKYWCKKHSIDLHVVTESDPRCGKPIWNKELVYEYAQGYEKIALVDADTMIKWNAPNFFDLFEEDFCMVHDDSNWSWVYKSMQNYSKFFNTSMTMDDYGNAGVLFFHKKYLDICEKVFKLYSDNKQELDDWNKGGGREQTIFNYMLKENNVSPKWLSSKWNLISMHKRELFKHNFQLGDNIPHFIKHGYIWHFTGFGIEDRANIVKQTWDLIKDNYND